MAPAEEIDQQNVSLARRSKSWVQRGLQTSGRHLA
jgi:hypothetical protein